FRGTSFDSGSDQARFERYRDLRNGAFLDRLRFDRSTDQWLGNVQADHVGYRDQRYAGRYNNYGKLKVSFEWNQTPLFFSQTTRSLYTTTPPGVLQLDDAVQSGIQNKTLTLVNAVKNASAFDLRVRRDVADLRLAYTATPKLDF